MFVAVVGELLKIIKTNRRIAAAMPAGLIYLAGNILWLLVFVFTLGGLAFSSSNTSTSTGHSS